MTIGGSRRIEDEGNVGRGKGVIIGNRDGGAIFQIGKIPTLTGFEKDLRNISITESGGMLQN